MSRRLKRILLSTVTLVLALGVLELTARVWVAVRWPEARAFELTHATETRGRYTSHPRVGYVLTPNFVSEDSSHDNRGLRRNGPEPLQLEASPGTARVALIGASTVYGIYVKDGDTAASQLEASLVAEGIPVETINGGVPGWTSREALLTWRERVGPLRPDVAILLEGRNEAFAQLWNDYRDDHTHYRDPNYELRSSNLAFKRVFRFSHLAMVVVAKGDWFGFSQRAEHPLYGAINYLAKPTPEQARAAAADSAREAGFEKNLRELVAELRSSGVAPVLATIPFRPEGFASGVFQDREAYIEAISIRVRANNQLVRRLAIELGVPLADLETLSVPELLHDDCHFNEEGERRAAALMHAAVAPLLVNAP